MASKTGGVHYTGKQKKTISLDRTTVQPIPFRMLDAICWLFSFDNAGRDGRKRIQLDMKKNKTCYLALLKMIQRRYGHSQSILS